MKLTLKFEFDEDTQYIVVTCPELGISAFGKTLPDAFEMIGDCGAVYLGTLEDLGELEEKVLGVAERIDADPEEIEQDIRSAVKAVRGELSVADRLAGILGDGLSAEEWQEIIEEPYG